MAVIGGDGVLGSMAFFHRGEIDDISIRTFERLSIVGIVLLSRAHGGDEKRGASTLCVPSSRRRTASAAGESGRAPRRRPRPALSLMLIEMDGPAPATLRGASGLTPSTCWSTTSTASSSPMRRPRALDVRRGYRAGPKLRWVRRIAACSRARSRGRRKSLYATLKRAVSCGASACSRIVGQASWPSVRPCSRPTTRQACPPSSCHHRCAALAPLTPPGRTEHRF